MPASELLCFFYTLSEPAPWVEFDLQRVRSIARVRVVNRADCCWERAVPLVVEVSKDQHGWREVARREEVFYDWSTSFHAHAARYVRLRALRPTSLHLTRVEIR